jgi:CheY-like chemotaxis protein
MFYQVSQGEHPNFEGGFGIGLTLAARIVELHGGTLQAYSEGLNAGSEFIVRLPLSCGGSRPLSSSPSIEPAAEANSIRRVLVVDDNADSAESLALLLSLRGFEVKSVLDGAAAIETAAVFLPDAVLLDIGMPQVDGYAVARHIRKAPWGKEMLLVAQTGWGQEPDRERSLEAGFDRHLTKPLDFDLLLRLLSQGAIRKTSLSS